MHVLERMKPWPAHYANRSNFISKIPEDEYETYDFSIRPEGVIFEDSGNEQNLNQWVDTHEIYCNRCSWHGMKKEVE